MIKKTWFLLFFCDQTAFSLWYDINIQSCHMPIEVRAIIFRMEYLGSFLFYRRNKNEQRKRKI